MSEQLMTYTSGIPPVCRKAQEEAKVRLDTLIKPPGSLGKLEDIAIKLAGITGKVKNDFPKKCILIMCADNGVVSEGVASAPQDITLAMAENFVRGVTGVAVLARGSGADIRVCDVGINSDVKIPGVLDRKIRKSTGNIKMGPAMSREEAVQGVLLGMDLVRQAGQEGYGLLGVGEMGIGNTTTTTAVLAALTGAAAESITGRGAGLKAQAYARKIEVIDSAVKLNCPDPKDPLDLIAKLGGLDMAAMAGAFLGAAYYGLPVVADGYISVASAYLAVLMCPRVRDYLFVSHISEEPGFDKYMELLGLEAPLNLNMRLGEGSGCALMFDVIRSACLVMNEMATFEEALAGSGEAYLEKVR